MWSDSPKISIITVCKNSENTIRETVLSVVGQSYDKIEYIVVDGNSDDNTLNILSEYASEIDILISENDNGIYDAMNKGIDLATGNYLFFLNSDDKFLHNRVVEIAVNAFSSLSPEIVFGNLLYLDLMSGKVSYKPQNKFNKIYLYKNMPCQPTIFYKKTVFDKCGKFRTDYKIVSDFEWILRAILRNSCSLQYIGVALTLFSCGGVSSSRYDLIHNQERELVYQEYFTGFERAAYSFVSRYFRSFTTLPVLSHILNMLLCYKLKNQYIHKFSG